MLLQKNQSWWVKRSHYKEIKLTTIHPERDERTVKKSSVVVVMWIKCFFYFWENNWTKASSDEGLTWWYWRDPVSGPPPPPLSYCCRLSWKTLALAAPDQTAEWPTERSTKRKTKLQLRIQWNTINVQKFVFLVLVLKWTFLTCLYKFLSY